MFATSGYFKGVDCPYFLSGLCERPYCHFRHVKKDGGRDASSTLTSSSNYIGGSRPSSPLDSALGQCSGPTGSKPVGSGGFLTKTGPTGSVPSSAVPASISKNVEEYSVEDEEQSDGPSYEPTPKYEVCGGKTKRKPSTDCQYKPGGPPVEVPEYEVITGKSKQKPSTECLYKPGGPPVEVPEYEVCAGKNKRKPSTECLYKPGGPAIELPEYEVTETNTKLKSLTECVYKPGGPAVQVPEYEVVTAGKTKRKPSTDCLYKPGGPAVEVPEYEPNHIPGSKPDSGAEYKPGSASSKTASAQYVPAGPKLSKPQAKKRRANASTVPEVIPEYVPSAVAQYNPTPITQLKKMKKSSDTDLEYDPVNNFVCSTNPTEEDVGEVVYVPTKRPKMEDSEIEDGNVCMNLNEFGDSDDARFSSDDNLEESELIMDSGRYESPLEEDTDDEVSEIFSVKPFFRDTSVDKPSDVAKNEVMDISENELNHLVRKPVSCHKAKSDTSSQEKSKKLKLEQSDKVKDSSEKSVKSSKHSSQSSSHKSNSKDSNCKSSDSSKRRDSSHDKNGKSVNKTHNSHENSKKNIPSSDKKSDINRTKSKHPEKEKSKRTDSEKTQDSSSSRTSSSDRKHKADSHKSHSSSHSRSSSKDSSHRKDHKDSKNNLKESDNKKKDAHGKSSSSSHGNSKKDGHSSHKSRSGSSCNRNTSKSSSKSEKENKKQESSKSSSSKSSKETSNRKEKEKNLANINSDLFGSESEEEEVVESKEERKQEMTDAELARFLEDSDFESDNDTFEECLKIYNESVPSLSKQKPEKKLQKDEKQAHNQEAPQIPGKKRVAHSHDSRPSKPAAPKAPVKMSPAEVMHNRLAEMQKRALEAAEASAKASSSTSQGTGSSKRQAHIPRSKSTEGQSLSDRAVDKRTVAITAARGEKRTAHAPTISNAKRPTIPAEFGSKVPSNIRQRYLNLIIDECLKICKTEVEAYKKGQEEETAVYKRATNKNIYLRVAVNAIKRLREETKSPTKSSPSKIVKQSHEATLGGKNAVKTTYTLHRSGNTNKSQTEDFKGADLYQRLSKYILTEEQLKENGYPRPSPEGGSRAIFFKDRNEKDVILKAHEKNCVRCGKRFIVFPNGSYNREEECIYHWGKAWKKRVDRALVSSYNCCGGDLEAEGCQVCKFHVYESNKAENVTGYMKTIPSSPPIDGNYGVYAMDCEMVYTKGGMELARVTVIDQDQKPVYEALVKPNFPVVDYNTRFSGLTEEDLKGVTTSLRDVQAVLLSLFTDRTILLGHSLESDLISVKLIHNTVVDTSIVFPHRLGPPYKRALRNLMSDFLKKIIQDDVGGHDSQEDALACLQLMQWKLKEDAKKEIRRI